MLLELLFRMTIGLILFNAILHSIFIIKINVKNIRRKLDYFNTKLIVKNYLGYDIRNSNYKDQSGPITCKAVKYACSHTLPSEIEKMINSQDIKANSSILLLNFFSEDYLQIKKIGYYIRESIIPSNNHMHSYALYRDDFAKNSVAIAEGISDFQVELKYYSPKLVAVHLKILFKNLETMELVYAPRNLKAQ